MSAFVLSGNILDVVGVAIFLGFLILLIKKKYSIGYILLMASFFLGILSGMNLEHIIKNFIIASSDTKNLELMGIIVLLSILGSVLEGTGTLARLSVTFSSVIKNPKIVLVWIPMLTSILPGPGGVMLSAPYVGEIGNRIEIKSERKTAIVIIFRHIASFFVPYSPPLILASKLSNTPIFDIISLLLPIVAIWLIAGYLASFRNVDYNKSTNTDIRIENPILEILKGLLPIIFPLLSYLLLKTSFIISLVLGIFIALAISNRQNVKIKLILDGIKIDIIILVIGVMVFKQMLDDSEVIFNLISLLTNFDIPLLLLITIASFTIGIITGNLFATVGIVFPIFLSLIQGRLGYIMIMYICAWIGFVLSPIHLCTVLANQYFNSKLVKVLEILLFPLLAVFLATIILFK